MAAPLPSLVKPINYGLMNLFKLTDFLLWTVTQKNLWNCARCVSIFIYTVPSESTHTPRLITHFVVLQPIFKIYFLTHLYTKPHNDKVIF
jgi:hypothetical protein